MTFAMPAEASCCQPFGAVTRTPPGPAYVTPGKLGGDCVTFCDGEGPGGIVLAVCADGVLCSGRSRDQVSVPAAASTATTASPATHLPLRRLVRGGDWSGMVHSL